MKRVALVTVTALLLGISVLTLSSRSGDPELIREGDTEARVLALLGPPDRTNGPPAYLSWGPNPVVQRVNAGECTREFTYLGRRGDVSWSIGFDRHGNVVSNHRQTAYRESVVMSR